MDEAAYPLSIKTEIVIILALVIINGILAMTEMAFVSSRKIRLRLKDPNRFLSGIQVGITLIRILAGVYGGQR